MRTTVVLLALLFSSGCDWLERSLADPPPSIADGGQLIGPNPVTYVVDLASVLDPNQMAKSDMSDEEWDKFTDGEKIDKALVAFYEYPGKPELRRNRVQERLLAESNLRCNVFKSIVHQTRSKTNFLLGSLSTISGVLGSIVTNADTSRLLSGTAGIFGGVRAELNQELFQNLATQVIVQGIDTRRREVYEKINELGQSKSIKQYPVEAAIKDALFYHGQCSVVVGFEVANDSIKTMEDPGINASNRILAKLATTRKLLTGQDLSPEDAQKILKSSNVSLPLAGTTLTVAPDTSLSPISALQRSQKAIEENSASFRTFVMKLSIPEEQQTENRFLNLKSQKDRILSVLKGAKSSVHASLGTCSATALKASRDILEAGQQEVKSDKDVPNTREKTLLWGQSVSAKIDLISNLFRVQIDAATAYLRKAALTTLATTGNLPDNVVDQVIELLNDVPKFENCMKAA